MRGNLRKLRFEQLERMDLLSTLSYAADPSIVEVQGGTLTVSSIVCDTLIIGGGAGGTSMPSGGPGTMNGGTLRYNSDAFAESIISLGGAELTCTDPADLANAWRSTEVVPGDSSLVGNVTRDFGPKTLYKNRFGNLIATEQEITDTENGVSTTTTSYIARVQVDDSRTVYAQETVTDIVPGTNSLIVETSDEGTVVYQHANYDFIDQQTVTKNGATQLSMTSDGVYNMLTIGEETIVTPLDPGLPVSSADLEVTNPKYVGVDGMFKVAHGTSVWQQLGSIGACPSGDYAQPESGGSGFYSISRNAPLVECTSVVMLFGTRGYSCNTLQSSDVSNNSGTIMGYMIGGSTGSTYLVSYYVEGFLYVTSADPSNPTVGGAPSGRVDATLSDASGFSATFSATCTSTLPIPNGKVLKVPIAPTGGVVSVTAQAGGAWVATLSPTMENRGPGLVIFVATMYIKSISKVTPPPPPVAAASPMAAEAFFREATWDIFKNKEVAIVAEMEVPVRKSQAVVAPQSIRPQYVDDWIAKPIPAQIHKEIFGDLHVNLMEALL